MNDTDTIRRPSWEALQLVTALSSPEDRSMHLQAVQHRDAVLSASAESYNAWVEQLANSIQWANAMHNNNNTANSSNSLFSMADWEHWKSLSTNATSPDNNNNNNNNNNKSSAFVWRLQQDASLWIPWGQMAGLVLKEALARPPRNVNNNNNNNLHFQLNPSASAATQRILLELLGSPQAALRNVASSTLAAVLCDPDGIHVHFDGSSVVAQLQQDLQQGNHTAASVSFRPSGALATIRKITEDDAQIWTDEHLDQIVPALLQLLLSMAAAQKNGGGTIRLRLVTDALGTLQTAVAQELWPASLVLHLEQYLQALSQWGAVANHVAQQNAQEFQTILTVVCQSIVTLWQVRREYLPADTTFAALVPFLMQVQQQQHTQNNPDGAREACEFWLAWGSTLLEARDDYENEPVDASLTATMAILQHHLPNLVPLLLTHMVHSADEVQNFGIAKEMVVEQDEPKPVFHTSRNMHGGGSGGKNDSDNDDDDDDDDDEYDHEWTLRKCAAASLDSLAHCFGSEIMLPILLPHLEQGLSNHNTANIKEDALWIQEACILALGAVAEGCRTGLEQPQYLGAIFPYLLQTLQQSQSQQQNNNNNNSSHTTAVRQIQSIAAWTIGRFAGWAVEQVQSGSQGDLLAQICHVFLQHLGGSSSSGTSKTVQIACGSALAVVGEAAGDLLVPYLQAIYQAVAAALPTAQGRPLLVLLDLLGILAECCGPAIGELLGLAAKPLMQLWQEILRRDGPSQNRAILPLLEALASTALAAAANFQPYSLECLETSMAMVETLQLELATASTDGTPIAEEEADPLVCAIDLMDSLVEGLGGANFAALLSSSPRYAANFFPTLVTLGQHECPSVRMSAIAILGDLCRNNVAPLMNPLLQQPEAVAQWLPQLVLSNMDIQTNPPSVVTNAVWAMGEVCNQCRRVPVVAPTLLEPYAPNLIQYLVALLMGGGSSSCPGLAENAAACAGRLALVNPQLLAADLPRFLLGWCDGMAKIVDATERRDAFRGFLQAVYANPNALQQAAANVAHTIASVLFCIVTWHIPNDEATMQSVNNSNAYSPVKLFTGEYRFRPFPATESELGTALGKLVVDLRASVGEETWGAVQRELPVNVRRLLREAYNQQ